MEIGGNTGYYHAFHVNQYNGAVDNRAETKDKDAIGLEKTEKNKEPDKTDKRDADDKSKSCWTCANRQYQDGSDDPGVSFKTPTKLSPEEAASAVRSHENEHVVNEQSNAKREGGKVVSQSVAIFTDVCPECKTVFVSGGETRTTVRYGADGNVKSDSASDVGKVMDQSA